MNENVQNDKELTKEYFDLAMSQQLSAVMSLIKQSNQQINDRLDSCLMVPVAPAATVVVRLFQNA